MDKAQTLSFTYKNIGNIVHLLVNLMFEKTHNSRDVTVYHQRFDKEPDDTYEAILEKLFPDGCTIGEQELTAITEHICRFMAVDDVSQDLFIEYDKWHWKSWVYFKPGKRLEYAEFGSHALLVKEICKDFFKGFEKIDAAYLRRFIMENFEIRSDNSTIETISGDAVYIARDILLGGV